MSEIAANVSRRQSVVVVVDRNLNSSSPPNSKMAVWKGSGHCDCRFNLSLSLLSLLFVGGSFVGQSGFGHETLYRTTVTPCLPANDDEEDDKSMRRITKRMMMAMG